MPRFRTRASRVLLRGSRAMLLGALGAGCAASVLEPTSTHAAAPQEPKACVVQRSEVRYSGAGYDHWVHLTNNCDGPVSCNVHTNVNQEGVQVTVAPSASESVLTWRGSPAREFSATVNCQFAS